MFHSAALRLTFWYLAIIMVLSIVFSGALYRLSVNELDRNVNRQIGYFNNFLGPRDTTNYLQLRHEQLDEGRTHLKADLVVFNLMVLVGGGAASYWLARRTLEPIEQALESQSRFAADASHELRTPLTAIQTENEVALRDPKLNKTQATDLLKSNLEEVAKLKALSEGLLKLANTSGRIDNPQTVAVKDIIEPAVERLAKAAELKHIKIVNKPNQLTVRGDPDSLVELVSILIDNAIKYSPNKSQVTIVTSRQHKDVLIEVADRGTGIERSELAKIFDRFYRSDSSRAKSDGGGYGLGLAIAKKIAEAHGGHIEVLSTLGSGSTFILHLPGA